MIWRLDDLAVIQFLRTPHLQPADAGVLDRLARSRLRCRTAGGPPTGGPPGLDIRAEKDEHCPGQAALGGAWPNIHVSKRAVGGVRGLPLPTRVGGSPCSNETLARARGAGRRLLAAPLGRRADPVPESANWVEDGQHDGARLFGARRPDRLASPDRASSTPTSRSRTTRRSRARTSASGSSTSSPSRPKEIVNWTECASPTNTVGNQGDVDRLGRPGHPLLELADTGADRPGHRHGLPGRQPGPLHDAGRLLRRLAHVPATPDAYPPGESAGARPRPGGRARHRHQRSEES